MFFNRLRFLFYTRKTFHLIAMREFLDRKNIVKNFVLAGENNRISGPKFIGNYPVKLHRKEIVQIKMPDVYMAEIEKAVVIAGTNLVIVDNTAIYPDLMNIEEELMPIEIFGMASVSNKKINIKLTRSKKKIPKAISLLGQFSGNYAHWLLEIIPKLVLIDKLDKYKDFPILLDGWNHPVFHESVKLLNKNNRELVFINRWESIEVDNLVELSACSYIQAESRAHICRGDWEAPCEDAFRFSKSVIRNVRERTAFLTKQYQPHKKVYLMRNPKSTGNGRLILNLPEVEQVLHEYGFEPFDVTGLSFEDQVKEFSKFKYIVSPIGAVLSNTVFTPESCKIIVLSPYYENASYYFFSNLFGVLNHEHRYVMGPQANTDGHIGHRDYFVDIDALKDALENYMNCSSYNEFN